LWGKEREEERPPKRRDAAKYAFCRGKKEKRARSSGKRDFDGATADIVVQPTKVGPRKPREEG